MDSFVWAGRQSDDAILYVANESLLIGYQGRLAGRSILCSDDGHSSQEKESRQNWR